MVNLKTLEAFVAVAETGSFGAAAQRLYTTQPNISNRISALEAQLGLSLFNRGQGKTTLSPKGRELLPLARDTLKRRDDFLLAAEAPEALDGLLRLGVSEVVAHSWLREFMEAFAEALPSVRVELTVDLSRNLISHMQDAALDLCFQTESHAVSGQEQLQLDEHPFVWVEADTEGKSERTLVDHLATRSLILPAAGTQPLLEFQAQADKEGWEVANLIPSTNLSVGWNLVRDGLGLGLLPLCMVEEDLDNGRLRLIEADWRPQPLRCSARFSKDRKPVVVERALDVANTLLHHSI